MTVKGAPAASEKGFRSAGFCAARPAPSPSRPPIAATPNSATSTSATSISMPWNASVQLTARKPPMKV
jgi:hypothetical protein